jgi:hypothetical protein
MEFAGVTDKDQLWLESPQGRVDVVSEDKSYKMAFIAVNFLVTD